MEIKSCFQKNDDHIVVPTGARILRATYGNPEDPAQQADVTKIVQNKMAEQKETDFVMFKAYGKHENRHNGMFPNPWKWNKKTLTIEYEIQEKGYEIIDYNC